MRGFLYACALPWRYVDLQDPGFELLIQHDVEAKQLVAAVRRPHVALQQVVDVRLRPDDRHAAQRFTTVPGCLDSFSHPSLQQVTDPPEAPDRNTRDKKKKKKISHERLQELRYIRGGPNLLTRCASFSLPG